jgi:hypothetical protein
LSAGVAERKRKPPSARQRLEVLARDNYTCVTCGRSPAITPGLQLEVDHIEPFSTGGADALANYQTLCQRCNRGKGDQARLNKTLAADIAILLDDINPEIRRALESSGSARVVANQEDFVRLANANGALEQPLYVLQPNTNTISGRGAGGSLGLHAVRDSGGQKASFTIVRCSH